jgi:hypothetical protein
MVEKLERYIADRWFEDDPQIKRWVAAHELLAQSLLMFDIDNDKLPI